MTRWVGCAFAMIVLFELVYSGADQMALTVPAVCSVFFQVLALFDERQERRDQEKRREIADVVSLWKQDR